MRIMRSIIKGERDPVKLAQMKDWRIRSSIDVIAKSLEGNYQEEQLFCLRQEVEQYDSIGAFYRRLRSRIGVPKVITATAI